MSSRVQLYCLIGLLLFIGLGGVLYKCLVVGYPLLPKEQVPVWTIEAEVKFEAVGKPVKVSVAVPGQQGSIGLLSEEAISQDYGFLAPEGATTNQLHRRAIWSRSEAEGAQHLYYRVMAFERKSQQDMGPLITTPPVRDPKYAEEPLRTAVQGLIQDARQHSADDVTCTGYLIKLFKADKPKQNVRLLTKDCRTKLSKVRVLHNVLLSANIETHLVRGLHLGESKKRQSLTSVLLVKDGNKWQPFVADRSQPGILTPFLAWQRGGQSLIDITGGTKASVTFSVLRNQRPLLDVIEESASKDGNIAARFSIYDLPIEQQNSLGLLLMVPLGALVIVILRNLVGIKTSGTFMPILLAMAFLQTKLLTGLVIFLLIVGVGLVVRSYLSRLDLLLVPRISAVVIVVIGIMVSVSIFGHLLEMPFARSVTLFPTIILAWTVERLSVLWEEDGPREVSIQTAGSLIAAILCYFIMGSTVLNYIVFTFPEALLIVLAVILVLGQYTGYRLSELRRFEPLAGE